MCPQGSNHDNAVIISGSELSTLLDAALLLACVALERSNDNLCAGKRWLRSFQQQVSGQISGLWLTAALVHVNAVEWLFPPAVSNWVVRNGVCERLEAEGVRDAAEMHRVVSSVQPVEPSTPGASMPASPALAESPAVGVRVAGLVLPEPVFVGQEPMQPGTPSPREPIAALLEPIELHSLDELMGW